MRSFLSRVETASPCRARTPRCRAASGSFASSQNRAQSSRSNAVGALSAAVALRHLSLPVQAHRPPLAVGGP
jgi:hypothetical protein